MLPLKVSFKEHIMIQKKPYIKMLNEKKKQEIKTHGYNSSNNVHTETRQEENSIC